MYLGFLLNQAEHGASRSNLHLLLFSTRVLDDAVGAHYEHVKPDIFWPLIATVLGTIRKQIIYSWPGQEHFCSFWRAREAGQSPGIDMQLRLTRSSCYDVVQALAAIMRQLYVSPGCRSQEGGAG